MSDENTLCLEINRLFDMMSSKEIDAHLTKIITAYAECDPPENIEQLIDEINKQIIIVNFFNRPSFRYEIRKIWMQNGILQQITITQDEFNNKYIDQDDQKGNIYRWR